MNSQKQDNMLSLAMNSTKEERQQSKILSVGIEEQSNRWEVIVKYHGNLEQIANDEVWVETLIAGYAIVTLPAFLLPALAQLEEVEYIEKPKSLVYGVYEAKLNSCVIPVQIPLGDLSGEGVLLAVIDSGIDYYLEDFRNGNESRILYLWDQGEAANPVGKRYPPGGFRNGVEYTREQINQALASGSREQASKIVPQQDNSGHGTAVAAIAASSNPEILLTGVAPKVDLLVVKMAQTQESDFPATTQLLRGVTYAIRKSLEVNKPLVINLSFGNTYGSHDGSSLVERFLDAASEIGRTCICVGAGNEAASGGHCSFNVKERKEVEVAIAEKESTTNIQFWKSYEDEITLTLVAPNQQEFQIEMGADAMRQESIFADTKVLIYAGTPKPYSTKQEIFFVFLPLQQYIDAGIWRFRIEEKRVVDGAVQLYLPPALQRNTGTRFLLQTPQLTMTIPASATRVVSIGAYDDNLQSYADFSGRGRREGFSLLATEGGKPDLVAPGVGILAAKAGGGSDSYTGTSFATPMVSGSAALLMEWGLIRGKDPYLYGEKIKAYLRKGATPLRGEENYPNDKVGWGALCVENSIP